MASDLKTGSPSQSGLGSPAAKAKAAETRRKNAESNVKLDARGTFALNILQQASRGCKILQSRLRKGKSVDPQSLQAATTLSGVAASAMQDE